jgi:hypothetical protein
MSALYFLALLGADCIVRILNQPHSHLLIYKQWFVAISTNMTIKNESNSFYYNYSRLQRL